MLAALKVFNFRTWKLSIGILCLQKFTSNSLDLQNHDSPSLGIAPIQSTGSQRELKHLKRFIEGKALRLLRTNFSEYRPFVPNLKNIVMSKWHLLENEPLFREIYKDPPLLSYRKERSLKTVLVRARRWRSKFSYLDQQDLLLACNHLYQHFNVYFYSEIHFQKIVDLFFSHV